jgi:hypothetical protein
MALLCRNFALVSRAYWRASSVCLSRVESSKLIHTSAKMSKEQIEELKANPYFDKYADKIAKLQK